MYVRRDALNNVLNHVSHSQIELFNSCPRKWEYDYVKGIKSPQNPALFLGDCYHRVLEKNFRYKMSSGEDIDIDIIGDIFETQWNEMREKSDIDWMGESPIRLRDIGITLICEYINEVAYTITPAFVEKEVKSMIGDVPFVAKIDLIDDCGRVIDHKTSGKAYSQKDINEDMQPSAYAYALGREINYSNHVAIKKGTPRIQIVNTYRDRADIEWWYNRAYCTVQQMKSGYYPARTDSWKCSVDYCFHYNDCRKGTAVLRYV